jgi:hypothetical protein
MKRVIIFLIVAGFYACNCLPQVPTQYLPADANCEAVLPNYLLYVSVFDNCQGGTLTQHPLPGIKLTEGTPWVTVTITAKDLGGRTDTEQFIAVLDDGIAPEIIWDSIPSDTIPLPIADNVNELDETWDSYVTYRAHLGDTIMQDSTWKPMKVWYLY